MVPKRGETPDEWWTTSGYAEAVKNHPPSDDPYVTYFHDVLRERAEEAMSKGRNHPSPAATAQPWPLDAWPDVPTTFVLGTEDRCFPAPFLRRLAKDRLAVVPVELAASHCVALSKPVELAEVVGGRRR